MLSYTKLSLGTTLPQIVIRVLEQRDLFHRNSLPWRALDIFYSPFADLKASVEREGRNSVMGGGIYFPFIIGNAREERANYSKQSRRI